MSLQNCLWLGEPMPGLCFHYSDIFSRFSRGHQGLRARRIAEYEGQTTVIRRQFYDPAKSNPVEGARRSEGDLISNSLGIRDLAPIPTGLVIISRRNRDAAVTSSRPQRPEQWSFHRVVSPSVGLLCPKPHLAVRTRARREPQPRLRMRPAIGQTPCSWLTGSPSDCLTTEFKQLAFELPANNKSIQYPAVKVGLMLLKVPVLVRHNSDNQSYRPALSQNNRIADQRSRVRAVLFFIDIISILLCFLTLDSEILHNDQTLPLGRAAYRALWSL